MKKFTNNDIFYNSLLVNPKYNIIMQSGSLRINDQINQNLEKSSSISGIDFGGEYAYKLYSGSYEYTASISRDFTLLTSSSGYKIFDNRFTAYNSLLKIAALKNIVNQYNIENVYANIDYYLLNNGLPFNKKEAFKTATVTSAADRIKYYIRPFCSTNMIQIPREFYGNYIKAGSLKLNMYVSGTLVASAADVDNTGKMTQTYGSGSGNIIGSVFYNHGIILLTGSQELNNEQQPYLQPLEAIPAVNDYLKWIYFGSYIATTGAAPETKYELEFQGTNSIPTLTMMCSAEKNELFWSNNRTFIEVGQGEDLFSGQATSSVGVDGLEHLAPSGAIYVPSTNVFQENKTVLIKNTVSSSFANYSASYQPQTFISEIGIYDKDKNLIGIAKLANPVRKTKELDYTFKLKLDL